MTPTSKGKHRLTLDLYPYSSTIEIFIDPKKKVVVDAMHGEWGMPKEDILEEYHRVKSKISVGRSVFYENGLGIVIIDINNKNFEGTVAHECFHMVTYVMRWHGLKLKIETSCEAYAYMLGGMVAQIMKHKKEYFDNRVKKK